MTMRIRERNLMAIEHLRTAWTRLEIAKQHPELVNIHETQMDIERAMKWLGFTGTPNFLHDEFPG